MVPAPRQRVGTRTPFPVATYRFWDGAQWTSNVSDGAVGGAKGSRGWRKGQTLIALGGVTLAVSPFLTWVKVVLFGDLNLLQLLQASGHGDALAWGAVLVGGAVALNVLTVGLNHGLPGSRWEALLV